MQFPRVCFSFLIKQALVLFNDVMPQIGHAQLPAHHSLKISVELLSLTQIHDIIYGLGGKVVLNSFALVFLALDFGLLMAGLQFGVALEKTGQGAADFAGDLGQVVTRLL